MWCAATLVNRENMEELNKYLLYQYVIYKRGARVYSEPIVSTERLLVV